jgi:hypothetical protein
MENMVRSLNLMGGWLALALLVGCESADVDGNFWQQEQAAAAPAAPQPATPAAEQPSSGTQPSGNTPAPPAPAPSTAGDEVSFSSLRFTYGNFNGARAGLSSPRIANLRFSSNALSYSWAGPNLSSWGMSAGQADAICCLFLQNSGGAWVGGKFDWISSSRTTRDLNHVRGGYGGWSLGGIPNPSRAAFVIISADGRRRSNVIAGTWQR